MAGAGEIARLDAVELARLVRQRELGPVEIVEDCLAVIADLDPNLNAFCTIAADSALAAAREAEDRVRTDQPIGPLHGVPVGIKDVTPTAGMRTTYACELFADHVPDEDALVVARLKQAGAIVIGKTNTPEFAAGGITDNALFGPTRNPWNPDLISGGSTGGGAAALASGMIPLAQGTDFGGSLRQPAALCGVVGIRPTPGLVPTWPAALPWQSLSVIGPMARTARDAALILQAISGPSPLSPISLAPTEPELFNAVSGFSSAGMRIAYASDTCGVGIEPGIEAVCRAAALSLRDAGADVEEISFDISDGRDAFVALRGQMMVANHATRLDRLDELGPILSGNIRAGLAQTPEIVAEAEVKRGEIMARLVAVFGDYDALLTPCVPIPAFPVGESAPEAIAGKPLETYIDWLAPTFVISLCAVPAASVPAGLDANGMPVGLQVIAPRLHEARVLGLADQIQDRNPIGRAPPI